jgi:putative addiction module component (TIGR02574 family)
MGVDAADLLDKVLALPDNERENFVTELLARLPNPSEDELGDEWIDEIERRLDQAASGDVVCEKWDVVKQRLLAQYPKE